MKTIGALLTSWASIIAVRFIFEDADSLKGNVYSSLYLCSTLTLLATTALLFSFPKTDKLKSAQVVLRVAILTLGVGVAVGLPMAGGSEDVGYLGVIIYFFAYPLMYVAAGIVSGVNISAWLFRIYTNRQHRKVSK